MTDTQVVTILQEAGFTVFGQNPICVLAQRPVPGMPHTFRAAICQVNADGSWRVGIYRHTVSASRRLRAWDYTPHRNHAGEHLRHERLTDVDELGTWLGGACSVPFGSAETAAIESGMVAA